MYIILYVCHGGYCSNREGHGAMVRAWHSACHAISNPAWCRMGGGPRVVVSTAAFHARVRGSVPGLVGLKETKMFLPHPRVKVNIVGSLRDREAACSASDRQVSNFQRNIMFLPFQSRDIVKMLCPWAWHFTLKCFTWLRWKWVHGRTEMAMCTMSSMRRNGCTTVCSPWSCNDTRMNRSSDQGGKM